MNPSDPSLQSLLLRVSAAIQQHPFQSDVRPIREADREGAGAAAVGTLEAMNPRQLKASNEAFSSDSGNSPVQPKQVKDGASNGAARDSGNSAMAPPKEFNCVK
jgi:hypothetical protein